MPQHKSAEKRVRQNIKRRTRNVQKRTQIKTSIKKVKSASDKEHAQNELKAAVSILDRMSTKGLIHKNKAANLKSKLTKMVDGM